MALHEFEHNGSKVEFFTLETSANATCYTIQAQKCGMTFDVGIIMNIENENPLIDFNSPIGINLAERIIKEFRSIR